MGTGTKLRVFFNVIFIILLLLKSLAYKYFPLLYIMSAMTNLFLTDLEVFE